MPLPPAAGTSVAVVVLTAFTAATVQFLELAKNTGGGVTGVIPWELVCYTIPGVLIGGQLAPLVASRGLVSDENIEKFAAGLFASVSLAFIVKIAVGG
jgi:uncharacterized membrane protein YfcA